MVEQAIDQRSGPMQQEEGFSLGKTLTITGTVFSSMGKIALAVGTTGLLLFIFASLETVLSIGTLYTGAAIIASGLTSMMLGNRMRHGLWFEGLLSA